MGELFRRDIKVTAGRLVIEPIQESLRQALKMEFSIEKTLTSTNKCELKIWNLKQENRAKLQERDIDVIIEAGYIDEITELFKGTLDYGRTIKEQTNWITVLQIGDGSSKTRKSRINESLRGPVSVGKVIKKVADALGVGEGNLADKVRQDGGRSILKEFVNGIVLSGKTDDVLAKVMKAAGLDFSIQSGKMQILTPTETTSDDPVLLKPSTGMLESPEIGDKGVVIVKSLLNGRLFPGRKVRVESLIVTGDFRIDKVMHNGDTFSANNWTSALEARPL